MVLVNCTLLEHCKNFTFQRDLLALLFSVYVHNITCMFLGTSPALHGCLFFERVVLGSTNTVIEIESECCHMLKKFTKL